MDDRCAGRTGKDRARCPVDPTYVDRAGRTWCHVHADRQRCATATRETFAGLVAYRRAQLPAGGTVTNAELGALGRFAKPHRAEQMPAWAARVRELLAESPLRSLLSAALQARLELGDGRSRTRMAQDGRGRSAGGSGRLEARGGSGGGLGRGRRDAHRG